MRIGERHFGFAITSAGAENLYQLAWYTDEEVDENVLENLYRQLPELRASYQQVNLCYDHPRSVLVPVANYQEKDTRLMLETMHGVNARERILTEALAEWQLNNVYAVPSSIHEWAGQYFRNGHYWHTYSLGIKNIQSTDFEGSLVVDFRTDDFSLIASKGNKILLTQTFAYSTPADVIYYLLRTCQEFAFSQDMVRLSLSGLVDKESVLYREIYQYFINVRFREPSWQISDAGQQDFPIHFFTSLNDLARCAS
jgi:Protein of unknown function (DUF3822)